MPAKSRKTTEVWPTVRKLQRALYLSDNNDARRAFVFAIETILMDTGNYNGYHHFDATGVWTREGIFYSDGENYYRRHYFGDPNGPRYITRERRDQEVTG